MARASEFALNRTGESRSVRHPWAIETPSADRPRRSDLRFQLSRAKRPNGTTCRRRDSNPRHADYDSARLWLCRAKFGRSGARMAHESHVGRMRGVRRGHEIKRSWLPVAEAKGAPW